MLWREASRVMGSAWHGHRCTHTLTHPHTPSPHDAHVCTALTCACAVHTQAHPHVRVRGAHTGCPPQTPPWALRCEDTACTGPLLAAPGRCADPPAGFSEHGRVLWSEVSFLAMI